jgi:hypothetical protein
VTPLWGGGGKEQGGRGRGQLTAAMPCCVCVFTVSAAVCHVGQQEAVAHKSKAVLPQPPTHPQPMQRAPPPPPPAAQTPCCAVCSCMCAAVGHWGQQAAFALKSKAAMLLAAVTRQQGPETYSALLPQLVSSAAEGPMQVCGLARAGGGGL